MGILDDAIKEHLELKRQHGADDSELKQLEDEAFGAAERPGDEGSAPDPLAEAPTEFMEQPPEAVGEDEEGSGRPSPRAEIADLQEAPPSKAEESAPEPEAPAEEESPAMEHEAVPTPPEPAGEPEISTGPNTAEREAIAEQPTEMYDIEEELSSSQAEAPSEEELVEEEIDEPRLAPVDPLAGLDADAEAEEEDEYEEDDDFWDEKRLSDELDQALEAPVEVEEEEVEIEITEVVVEEEVEAEEPPPAAGPDEDVLEETPDFLEEAPEDDQLWFEQKPPKDFDFDD
jgi:CapZ-interacting protein